MARTKRFDVEFANVFNGKAGILNVDKEKFVSCGKLDGTMKAVKKLISELKNDHYTVLYISRNSKEDEF